MHSTGHRQRDRCMVKSPGRRFAREGGLSRLASVGTRPGARRLSLRHARGILRRKRARPRRRLPQPRKVSRPGAQTGTPHPPSPKAHNEPPNTATHAGARAATDRDGRLDDSWVDVRADGPHAHECARRVVVPKVHCSSGGITYAALRRDGHPSLRIHRALARCIGGSASEAPTQTA